MDQKYNHSILCVDDEESILKALKRAFRKENYDIHTAGTGVEALALIDSAETPFSLIISDQRMPEMSGIEFLENAKKKIPDAIRILLTGYSEMDIIIDAINKGEIHRYLVKPWNDDDLIFQVRHALEQYELLIENKRLLALTRRQNKKLTDMNKNLEEKVAQRTNKILETNIELSNLNKTLEDNFYNTIRAFSSLSELNMPWASGHGRRVSRMSRHIALLMNLPKTEVIQIEIAALLHDIGKMGLPEHIFKGEESKWSTEDKRLYKKHPIEGQKIVQFIDRLDQVGKIIRSHHEMHNGTGFPDGLKENNIPLGARIISVADIFDKITHLGFGSEIYIDKYLKGNAVSGQDLPEETLKKDAAAYHIKKNAFTLYDAEVVKYFLTYFKENKIEKKPKEVRIDIDNLKTGMVLARSLYTTKGRFLLPHETVLTDNYIAKLKVILKHDPIKNEIYVLIN